MTVVYQGEKNTHDDKIEWHAPSLISVDIEEITLGLGKLGSSFDGPGMPNEFSDD